MAGRRIHVSTRVEFFNLLDQGYSVANASKAVGISRESGYIWKKKGLNLNGTEGGSSQPSGKENRQRRVDLSQSEPVSREWLSAEALRALDDFDYFRLRYFGRRATPWQRRAADEAIELLSSPHDEYVVMNEPPGAGKSTWGHDFCVWLIVRDRAVRELLGSVTQRLAEKYSNRVRRTLERPRPLPAMQGCIAAEASLCQDFGRFKPLQAEGSIWTRAEFTVASGDGLGVEDKEPTVAAYGMDTEFIGHRANLVLWDDLVNRAILRNKEQIDNQRSWWAEYGETRVEPGGLLLLVGQRMGADDLYRHCLDMEIPDELIHVVGRERKYHHIVFPAHIEDQCQGDHAEDAKPWPEGCLLDPVRLPWSKLATIEANRGDAYRVQYQQEDVDPAEVLVPKLWIDGGRDPKTGEQHPGCWDKDRDVAQLPSNLAPPLISYATADPSPTKYWAVQWWISQPHTNQHFLMDLLRQSMDAPDFLDWNQNAGVFFGVMEEWQVRSKEMGVPITHWIVENNAAQRFILQYDHVRRWQRVHGVQVIAHSTHRNKTDPDYGIQMLKNPFRYGQIRLPGRDHGRIASLKLIDEVTKYPQQTTDDCLMAAWFGQYHLANGALHRITDHEPTVLRRPTWMRRKVAA